ncbi:MAG: glycine hydroxymethyltransferase [Candidatus Paceibacteria bacterium]
MFAKNNIFCIIIGMKDKEVKRIIKIEKKRQRSAVNLIASENYVSKDVLEALGSQLTNKYAEGYSQFRYYGGNEYIDEIEDLAKKRAVETFCLDDSWHVNVQPLSGSPANLAAYLALVPVGGKIMGMSLSDGGHLTHGHKVSITGKVWEQISYGVGEDEHIDYEVVKEIAISEKPTVIVAGYTAYPRIVDWKKFREIADACGAKLMVDMSHIAGLVAGGEYPSPFEYADVVTTTTHKTLRGSRGAIIFCKKELAKDIDKAVFPGIQGGPHMNQIAGTAVTLKEAQSEDFKKYIRQVVLNAKTLSEELKKLGWRIVSGGTDTHLFLVDTISQGVSGKEASSKLEKEGIIVNKNTIPKDTRSPMDPSGIRIGTAFVTTQGMDEKDMVKLAGRIDKILKNGR